MEINENNDSEQSDQSLLDIEIRLTKQEIVTCLQATSGRSIRRQIVQTVILIIIFITCILSYFVEGMKTTGSLITAIASVVILAVLWLIPFWHDRFTAGQIASEQPIVRLKLYDDKIIFGGQNAIFPLKSCRPTVCGDILILEIGHEIVGIPRRIAGEEGFEILMKKFELEGNNREFE